MFALNINCLLYFIQSSKWDSLSKSWPIVDIVVNHWESVFEKKSPTMAFIATWHTKNKNFCRSWTLSKCFSIRILYHPVCRIGLSVFCVFESDWETLWATNRRMLTVSEKKILLLCVYKSVFLLLLLLVLWLVQRRTHFVQSEISFIKYSQMFQLWSPPHHEFGFYSFVV